MRNSLFLVLSIWAVLMGQAQDSNFHVYLCFGQSNMEGSAVIEKEDKQPTDRFLVLQNMDCKNYSRSKNTWYPAIPPLSNCQSGLSPADYFGKTLVANLPDSVRIGVINVAVGGCDIRLFDKNQYQNFTETYPEEWFQKKIKDYDGNPYQYLVNLGKRAQKDGVIKGILLHQGESNTGDEEWPKYVAKIYKDLLTDLGLQASEVPLLAGEVVHAEQGGTCAAMNIIINKLPNVIPTAHVVTSKGCEVQKDLVHFNSAGVREIGKRYATKMLQI
ncbi:sialate O-acetylesterase [Flavobacterium sp. ASW18X]|uniref:sialate O-acetylesterase n=1 Tax=Flavobacterium sp. ASW18X TaxID=2572595 RepID=UPI0010ADF466|nr:sialate O-acetylesterase [Flavobacterium sp. ASW18X]TKD62513.1 sialate O-acetylesterase [Flavobacterium sp. ASW18X]